MKKFHVLLSLVSVGRIGSSKNWLPLFADCPRRWSALLQDSIDGFEIGRKSILETRLEEEE